MRRSCIVLVALFAVAGCNGPTEADRQKLIGLWIPEDGSGQTVEFKEDGVFDFKYSAIWRLKWELKSATRVELLGVYGGSVNICTFEVEGDRLTLHDGSGESCDRPRVTPPQPIPVTFRRAP